MTVEIIDVRSHESKPISTAHIDSGHVSNHSDRQKLVRSIVSSLDKPQGEKSIPTLVLYNDRGLQLFDDITHLDEYYLTNAEMDILKTRCAQIVSNIQDGSAIVELGSGALRKTSIILDCLNRHRRNITYYALDLMLPELQRSLLSLGTYENIKLKGLLGTYDQGLEFLKRFTPSIPKVIMWLGSSIGNFERVQATEFLQNFEQNAMNVGDLFLIGIDRRNNPQKIQIAYNDPKGVTKEFIMNGLDHVNEIIGESIFDRSLFKYDAWYNSIEGRHEAYYQSIEDQVLKITGQKIPIVKGERLHIEYSYKYSREEVDTLFDRARLSRVGSWADNQSQYDLHLVYRPPFYQSLANIQDEVGTNLPTLKEWEHLWQAWDTVTLTMIPEKMLLEKPIDLRHPCIFYIGHIPTFLDLILSRHLKEPYTEPVRYSQIFERGIDPDMDDPTKCHHHSEVPDEWPLLDDVLEYRDRVRLRLKSVYTKEISRRLGRVISMGFEHEVMHLETLLYMLIQSPSTRPPKDVSRPIWDSIKPPADSKLKSAIGIHIESSKSFSFGSIDDENKDGDIPVQTVPYTWDNERPPIKFENIPSFTIASRPITNGEYLEFLEKTMSTDYPASWVPVDKINYNYRIRTIWPSTDDGISDEARNSVSMKVARDWPVMGSAKQLSTYAKWIGARLPREEELRLFLNKVYEGKEGKLNANVGFQHWHPTPVGELENTSSSSSPPPHSYLIGREELDGQPVYGLGSAWEWTGTKFTAHPGFKISSLYPGYSSDFFDDKHNVVVGASWATHSRIVSRWRTFRNWYNYSYGYAWATARLLWDN